MANTTTITRDSVIYAALRKCGVVPQGGSADPEQISEAAEAFEVFIKHLQAIVGFRWNSVIRTQAIVAGTYSYALTSSTDVVDLYDLVFRDSDNEDHAVVLVDNNFFAHEYSDKITENGTPNIATAQFDRSSGGTASVTVQVYPVPSAAGTLRYRALTKQQNMGAGTDTQNLDELWFEVLIYGLASRLADEYVLPIDRCTLLESKYQKALDAARNKSTPSRDTLCIYPI